ncbi:MAG: ATP-binding cassette domain-containing protein [Streptosporangiales bacterium]|nr:ATP-binding cassette domain-containing protein [Streptosporangiales bacterium]
MTVTATTPTTVPPVLEVADLVTTYPAPPRDVLGRPRGTVQAVSSVSLSVAPGETVGVVGESGCGKSTLGRSVLGLERTDAGTVRICGQDVLGMRGRTSRALRAHAQMVFQDPFACLNPRLTVADLIAEPLKIHRRWDRATGPDLVARLLGEVGLEREHGDRYPHEFSGGQRQRIGIARALALQPDLIVLDEPVSALDVSVQAGVLNLLDELQQAHDLAYLFIAHDLSVVHHISDRIAVMYLGKIVEIGDADVVYETPAHPYTTALLSAVPAPDPRLERERQRVVLTGDVPRPTHPPSGCRFRTRCWKATEICATEEPPLAGTPGRMVACHHPERPVPGSPATAVPPPTD